MAVAITTNRPWRRAASAFFVALALGWSAYIGWIAWSGWPRLSLDSASDEPTIQAHRSAKTTHLAYAIALGGGGSALLVSLAVLLGRRRTAPSPAQIWTGPSRILIMRHAEKTGELDDIHLSKAGLRRAERLASYIPETFCKPDFIFAAARSRRSRAPRSPRRSRSRAAPAGRSSSSRWTGSSASTPRRASRTRCLT